MLFLEDTYFPFQGRSVTPKERVWSPMFLLPAHGGSSEGKSSLAKWYEKVSGISAKAKHHAKEGGLGLAQTGESLLVGGILGATEAHFGSLDVTIKGHQVPADAAGALLLLGGATMMAHDPVAAFGLRNAAASAATIWGYRKAKEFVAAKTGATATHHGEFEFGSEDPILRAARDI